MYVVANVIEKLKTSGIPKNLFEPILFIIALNVEDNNMGSPNFVLEGKNLDK
jgi:hypothetical protein